MPRSRRSTPPGARRTIRDKNGQRWDVFELDRAPTDTRITGESALGAGGTPASRRWLCFESDFVRKRLAPFPAEWARLPPEELLTLCRTATVFA